MIINIDNVDIEGLRKYLINYFGPAMYNNPLAISVLTEIEEANPEELVKIATSNNIDIEDYIIEDFSL